MPRFRCVCDKSIWEGQIPCPYDWRFLSEADAAKVHGEVEWLDLYLSTSLATLCPRCRRMHLWIHGFGKRRLIYRPSTESDYRTVGPMLKLDEPSPSWSTLFARSFPGHHAIQFDAAPPEVGVTCACGREIRAESRPWRQRWLFMSDVVFMLDAWGDTVEASAIFDACGTAILCPQCARLLVFAGEPGRATFTYAPESPEDWPTCDAVEGDASRWLSFYGDTTAPSDLAGG